MPGTNRESWVMSDNMNNSSQEMKGEKKIHTKTIIKAMKCYIRAVQTNHYKISGKRKVPSLQEQRHESRRTCNTSAE